LKNDYLSEKSLALMVYGRNTSYSDIGNYSKNESVRMWGVDSHLIIDTFSKNASRYDLVFAINNEVALAIDGETKDLITSDGSIGYTGTCSTTLVIKQGIVVGCV
jgi:hypothetical protein